MMKMPSYFIKTSFDPASQVETYMNSILDSID